MDNDEAKQQPAPTGRLIRLPEVKHRTGLSTTTIYEKARAGEFPKPISIGKNISAWIENEVAEWIAERIKAARQNGGDHVAA